MAIPIDVILEESRLHRDDEESQGGVGISSIDLSSSPARLEPACLELAERSKDAGEDLILVIFPEGKKNNVILDSVRNPESKRGGTSLLFYFVIAMAKKSTLSLSKGGNPIDVILEESR